MLSNQNHKGYFKFLFIYKILIFYVDIDKLFLKSHNSITHGVLIAIVLLAKMKD